MFFIFSKSVKGRGCLPMPQYSLFFLRRCVPKEKMQKDTLSYFSRKTVSDWLTENPARSFSFPWCQDHGISFDRFTQPWQKLAHVADSSLGFSTELGSCSGLTPSLVPLHRHVWWTDASGKRTVTTCAQRKTRIPLGLESHFMPVRRVWPHSLKYHRNTQVLPRRQRGDTVSRV